MKEKMSVSSRNYVIVGNSASGVAAIEAIRECDKNGEIIVISDEPNLNYSRPLISYLLGKKVTLDKMPYRSKDFYSDNKVKLILGEKAAKLNFPLSDSSSAKKQKIVILTNREKIYFDKLLIATGGIPISPQMKGSDLSGIFNFTKLVDVERIDKYIKTNRVKEAIVIGGGLIGLKATEALIELKIKVTIVELADRILFSHFDKKASGIIERALERIDCKLITNNTVAEIKGKNKRVKEVILKDKKSIPADLVIVAIGVRPNVELVKGTAIKTNKGILVDNFMQTNIDDIYAAGDCCEAKDLLSSINRPIAIWPVAVRGGKIAGFNMAGRKKEYHGNFAMNSIELCGIPTISIGESCPDEEGCQVLESYSPEKSTYKKIVIKNERIVGAIFVGDIERAGIYTGLIRDKVKITNFKEYLLKEDFGLISLPKAYRKHLVAGEVAII